MHKNFFLFFILLLSSLASFADNVASWVPLDDTRKLGPCEIAKLGDGFMVRNCQTEGGMCDFKMEDGVVSAQCPSPSLEDDKSMTLAWPYKAHQCQSGTVGTLGSEKGIDLRDCQSVLRGKKPISAKCLKKIDGKDVEATPCRII